MCLCINTPGFMHYVSTSFYVSYQPRMHSVETPATDRTKTGLQIPLILRKLVSKTFVSSAGLYQVVWLACVVAVEGKRGYGA